MFWVCRNTLAVASYAATPLTTGLSRLGAVFFRAGNTAALVQRAVALLFAPARTGAISLRSGRFDGALLTPVISELAKAFLPTQLSGCAGHTFTVFSYAFIALRTTFGALAGRAELLGRRGIPLVTA